MIKEVAFTPTPGEAQMIQDAMDHRHIKRISEYARMAIMQVVRRELAARSKKAMQQHSDAKTSQDTDHVQ